MTSSGSELEPARYAELLAELKARVRATRFRAARAANTEVLRLYWSVGHDILDRQREAGWGSRVIDQLSSDLRREFPDQRGWSPSNLKNMRRIAEVWPTLEQFGQQAVGRLPWGHVVVLLERLGSREERDWYAARAAQDGWSRAVLEHQIKADLRRAVGAAPTNFTAALEAPDSDLAQQLVKDPYVFEHLAMVERVVERDVEQALMDRLQDTMLELGRGMAFVDDQFRRSEIHAPTIGILLCTGKTGPTVRYALASTSAPVAVADYKGLPEDARGVLPSAAELEAVIEDELDHRGLRAEEPF